MAIRQELTPLSDADYESIESAVMETGRGRWFLAEFARRNRTADTNMLLEAISRLENSVGGEKAALAADHVRQDLMEMAKIIAQLKIELASDDPEVNRFEQATEALDAVVRTTENATSSILEAAEQIQEIAWTLREQGASDEACDTLNQRAADIYTACSFQDLTAQRTKKVVLTMRSIEGRINGLMDAWKTGEAPAAPADSTIMTTPDGAVVHRRHLYSPVRISRQQLALDDIDLVMRGDADELSLMEDSAFLPSAPAHQAGDGQVTSVRFQAIDPNDIMVIDHDDHVEETAESIARLEATDATAAFPQPFSPSPELDVAAGPSPFPVQGQALTLAEIDALPADGKIRMFS
jgi:hypothetical protein